MVWSVGGGKGSCHAIDLQLLFNFTLLVGHYGALLRVQKSHNCMIDCTDYMKAVLVRACTQCLYNVIQV